MSADAMAVPAAQAAPAGLNSPPDSNSAMKDGGSDSELSDLEPDNDKFEAEPDHFSDGNVPVFKPTTEEFADFTRYMAAVNKWGMRTGIVKVIPPAEWVAQQPRLDQSIKTVRVKEPIKQDIMGTGGTYRQANIVHQRSYNLPQWRQLCEQSEHQPPAKRGERRANPAQPAKATPKPKGTGASANGGMKKRSAGRPSKNKAKAATVEDDEASTPDRLPTPVSPSMKPEEDSKAVKFEPEDDYDTPMKPKGGRQPKAISVSSRRKNNKRETGLVDEAAFKDFKYELEGEDYSPERCEELERAYWKTLTYAPPLYGADMPGTLFDDRTTTWNLGKLDNILDVLGSKIPGVNTAYLYLGMWKATFAWHLEDVDLYSINYLHFGAPKQWYSISQGDARRFEAAMKNIWPTDAKACDQFLRHKTFLISPATLLSQYNIKVNKITHHPGEFVITFPYGYHSGYNLGYNCAEAVNFGLESWLEYGRVAKKCNCSEAQDSVWIDVHEIDRKLRGEETEYEETDEEEEDDDDDTKTDLLTPPDSNSDIKPKIPRKKRKRVLNEKEDNSNVKRIRVRIKAPSKEPCILCPNDIPSEPLLVTEDGQKAHRMCAMYIPETSIESDTIVDVRYINKARLELKCNYCRSKKGACFQCSQKKCTRAYHATCAAAAGVLVEQGEIPVFGEDGTEYKEWGIEFSCRFHRSKRDKKYDGDALGEDKRLVKAGLALEKGDVCQLQYFKGDIFAGAVVENRPSEETVLVDVLPRGDRVEVEYKWLLIPDPADFRLQKPSVNAIPMPKSFKAKASLNTTKRLADDLPRADDPFVKGFTWAEFRCERLRRNPAQVKVDLSKENQTWFYLGKNSTEAKAQFTEDPSKSRHNPKGHFLDTITKPGPSLQRQSYAATYPSNLNPNTSNASKAASVRIVPPPQHTQPTATSVRMDKPYAYKPRDTSGDAYRIDQQAYSDQQNFLQRSATAPYAFGTDPRYRENPRPVGQYPPYASTPSNHGQQAPAPAPRPVQVSAPRPQVPFSRPPQMATARSQQLANPLPQQMAQLQQNVGPMGQSPRAVPPMTVSQSMYQQPRPPTASKKPVFNSKSHASTKPNPFAKYTYLQKEHNRSPLEYKSPYRPGGGFMNGYQGSLQAHLQQTLFPNVPRSSTSLSSLTYSSLRPSYSGSPAPNSTYAPSTSGGFHSHRIPVSQGFNLQGQASSQQSQSRPASVHKQSPAQMYSPAVASPGTYKTLEKDTTQLHPAIRQEYGTMPPNQYQPPPPRPVSSQSQNSVLQPPAMYNRQAAQMQPVYQSSPAPYQQEQYRPNQPLQQNAAQYRTPQERSYQSPQSQQHHSPPYAPGTQNAPPETGMQMSGTPSYSQPYSQFAPPIPHKTTQMSAASPQTHSSPALQKPVQRSLPSPQPQYPSAVSQNLAETAASQPQVHYSSPVVQKPVNLPVSQQQSQFTPPPVQKPTYAPGPQQQYRSPPTATQFSAPPPAVMQQYQPQQGMAANPVASQQQYQYHEAVKENEKPLYPHQQYFQHTPQQSVQVPRSIALGPQPRDFPDVPADSTTLVEKMMMALKKAPATGC